MLGPDLTRQVGLQETPIEIVITADAGFGA